MTKKSQNVLDRIIDFIKGKTPPLPFELYYTRVFEHRLHECAKRNPALANDFIKFLGKFDPAAPKRGTDADPAASKTDFGRQGYSGRRGYRTIYYYDPEKKIVVLFVIYAKNQQTDLEPDEEEMVAEMIQLVKDGRLELIPFTLDDV
jgi:mRNA-degrading endonuclease RelE of RelBE toxin-antitoxin system